MMSTTLYGLLLDGQSVRTGGVMDIRLKCGALQEFTFGDGLSCSAATPAKTR